MAREQISRAGRILAAADVMAALTAARPHRAPLEIDAAAVILETEVRSGKLDREAVAAVISAAGGSQGPSKVLNPGSLTEREVEVLGLIARGHTNRRIGEELFISPKTVGRHVENIYAKIGVSTRAGATLWAMEHRVLG
jgi:DNA-binding NarL/FixJ family response regulator